MTTIGYAVLQIVPSLRGVSAEINKQLAAMPDVGTNAGKVLGAGIKLGIAGGAAAAAVAVGGIGIALSKGFDRLKSIDQASFKLKALGHSADETKQIMDNALASVKGTAFSLGDAANIAASAVAAGVKPGKDLAKYLSDVADAAAVSGQDLASTGDVMNNVTTLNAAYNDSLQILAQRGLPIYDWLSKATGKTTAEVKQLASEGKISAETFRQAIETNIGGAAKTMGQSFDGAVDNMEASVARLGANFITAILGGDPANALAGPTEAIGNLTTKFDDIGVWVNAHSGEIHAFFEDIKNVAIEVGGAVKNIGEFLLENKGILEATAAAWVGWKAISAVASVAGGIKAITAGLGGLGAAAEVGGAGAVAGLSPLVSFLAANPIVAALAGGAAFGAGIGPLLNAHTDAALQKQMDDFNNAQRENASHNRAPAIVGPTTGGVQGPGIAPAGPQTPVSPPGTTGTYDPNNPLLFPYRHAMGGAISGPGTGTSDSILAWLSTGEYIVNADSARKNMPLLNIINSGKLPGYADGGAVDAFKKYASQISGGTYVRGGPPGLTGTDCSGAQAALANFLTGGSGRFSTGNEGAALSSRGFQLGDPPPGVTAYWVGWKNGGPGGGHTAGTIVDPQGGNVNVEMGGSSGGGGYGGSAGGASGFGNRAWIAIAGGGNPKAPNFSGEDPNAPNNFSSGSSGGSSGGGISLPSSLSGLSSFGLDSLGSGVGTTGSGSDLGLFGKAAGAAVSGQVSSALGVFGVNDSPGWLKGISQLAGGISFGQGGSSASPLSARPTATGTPPPDDAGTMHGTRANQQPGPVFNTTISAFDTTDALRLWDSKKNQMLAAKTTAY